LPGGAVAQAAREHREQRDHAGGRGGGEGLGAGASRHVPGGQRRQRERGGACGRGRGRLGDLPGG